MSFKKDEVKKLREVHSELFRKMTYTTDLAKHKVLEYWEGTAAIRPAGGKGKFKGDCEEFAMLAVQKARAHGFDARLVTCRDETGAGHCIAEVSTHEGDESYFLDNRQDHLATQKDLAGYRFHAVSPWNPMPGDKRHWYMVDETA